MTAPAYERPTYRRVDRSRTQDLGIVYRVLASIAAAVPLIIGLIATASVPWSSGGFDAPAVDVAGMSFTPAVAVGTAVLGLIALLAAASRDRASKLVMGAVFVCGALAMAIAQPDTRYVRFEDGHAWMFGLVGAALIAIAVLMSFGASRRRVVETDAVV
jgi:hypothetical protein